MYRNFLNLSDITSTIGSCIPGVYNPLHTNPSQPDSLALSSSRPPTDGSSNMNADNLAHTRYHSPKRILNNTARRVDPPSCLDPSTAQPYRAGPKARGGNPKDPLKPTYSGGLFSLPKVRNLIKRTTY